jgi:hypothetical protein
MPAVFPLSTLLSQVLVAFTIELDNEFERRHAQAGGGARVTSLVMWSNFMRFVGDGITVGDLLAVAGLSKARMLSTLGGMERWRYVFVGTESAERPPTEKRDGWVSSRGLRTDWVVRPTPAGRKAREIWQALFADIEQRWEERFGTDAIGELRGSLRAIVTRLDIELPEYLPIVGSANGMAADLAPPERSATAEPRQQISSLLSQALLAYTIDFESESELSLPLTANFVRVLDETDVAVPDLPDLASTSKEATSMALRFLAKAGYVVVDGASPSTSVVRLTPKGREVQEHAPRLHAEVEDRWAGVAETRRLRASLQHVLEQGDGLSRGLEPYPEGWRASKPYLERTKALIADPRAALPHYPLVLHRGGWPDGS